MIEKHHVTEAHERFRETLALANAECGTSDEATARGGALWEAVGMTPEVRAELVEFGAMVGPCNHTAAFLFGAMFALLAVQEAYDLEPLEEHDWDAALADLTGEG